MSDHTVLVFRIAIIALGCYCGVLTWTLAFLRRHSLNFWEGMTRASIGLFFFASSFATLSSLIGFDPDLRVTLLFVAVCGTATGLTMTWITKQENNLLPHPIESVANRSTPFEKGTTHE